MTLLTFLLKKRWEHITNRLLPSRATPHSRTATSALQQWDKEQLWPQPPSLRSWQPFYHCEPVTGGQWCQEAEIEVLLLSHKAERASRCTMRCQKVHGQDGEIPLTSCKAHHLVLTFTRSAGKDFSFPCDPHLPVQDTVFIKITLHWIYPEERLQCCAFWPLSENMNCINLLEACGSKGENEADTDLANTVTFKQYFGHNI